MFVSDLKTNHETELLGLDKTPWFSWKIHSEEHDTTQHAYRITVRDAGKVVWDSGTRNNSDTVFITYEGAPLASCTRYFWTVTVWDNHGNESSEQSWFETAFLDRGDWKAVWVEDTKKIPKRKKGFGNQPPATLFRRRFSVPEDIVRARLYATAHGVYEVSLNGRRPDDRLFAPEYSSYDRYLSYQTYDVTALLKQGDNAIGFTVADGWYFCPITTMSGKTAAQPHAVLYQLEIVTKGGKTYTVCSDGSEKAADSPVVCSDLFAGELYDANRELDGWDTADFDDASFRLTRIRKCGLSNLAAQIGAPVRAVRELPVRYHYLSPKGEHVLDFGQVLAGHVRFRANLPKGAKLVLEHFETTDPKGNCFDNILGMKGVGEGVDQKVVFVSAGKEATYEARFSFHGFRYVRVTGLDKVDPNDFIAVAISTDKAETGTFTCSDPRLVRLYENTRWSQRANMLSIPTDCPQREKAGWTGDIGIYAATSLQNEDTTGLLTRWLASLAADQAKDGTVPIVVPNNRTYQSMGNLIKWAVNHGRGLGVAGWGDACHLVPMALYRQTGNTRILSEYWPVMKAWGDFIIKTSARRGNKKLPKDTDRYLWNTGFHFGEWLIPSRTKDGISAGSDMKQSISEGKEYIPEIYAYIAMQDLSEAASVLGLDQESSFYGTRADKIRDAFADGVIREDGSMPVDVMGAYIIPLHYGLVPEKYRERYLEKILSDIDKNGGCLDTGFLGTPVILDTLSENGRVDRAYDLLFQTACPSWLYEVENGATTIWESWITKKPDGTPLAVSLNHYAFGCVDDWMFRNITGIVPTSPGYRTFRVAPVLDARLTAASRTFESEFGRISSSWTFENGLFTMSVTIPPCTNAVIRLPSGEEHKVGSGDYRYSCTL